MLSIGDNVLCDGMMGVIIGLNKDEARVAKADGSTCYKSYKDIHLVVSIKDVLKEYRGAICRLAR